MFQPVRGTRDLIGAELSNQKRIIATAQNISERYMYEEISTPIFEFSQVFHRVGESSDIVNKETYSFQDRGDNDLTLRPEGTAAVMRALVSNGLTHLMPQKLFYSGPMFRYDRPQKGRYRQFTQIGVEFVGSPAASSDVETIALGAHILSELGILDNTTLEINTLGDQESRAHYREALQAYFTPYQADLSEDSQRRLVQNPLRILDSKNKRDQELSQDAPLFHDSLTETSKAFFADVLKGLEALNIAYTHNQKLVRGLDYYCHTAFEFVTDTLGAQGTVLAGGRYDGLVKAMGGPDLPGIGWAAGIDRLSLLSEENATQNQVVSVIPIGASAQDAALTLAQAMRAEQLNVDLGFAGNLSKRMKRANKISAHWAVIFGEDELENGQASIKDLSTGEQETVAFTAIIPYIKTRIA